MPDKQLNPPKWAESILDFCCRTDYHDEIIGDLREAFYWRIEEEGTFKAKSKFLWESLLSLKPQNLKTSYHLSINTMILRNYIKVTSRNLIRRKTSSLINVLGLSLGITAFMLIFLYTFGIFTFDDYHTEKDHIFMAYKERITPDGIQPTYDTWVPMANRLKSDYPEVKSATSLYLANAKAIKNEVYIDEEIFYSSQDFFDIFSFEIIQGRSSEVLPEMSSMAISEAYAVKYFGDTEPLGQFLDVFLQEEDTILTFQISAVIGAFPENVSIQPNMVIRLDGLPFYPDYVENWGTSFLETYLTLDEQASVDQLIAQFPDLVEQIWDGKTRGNTDFRLLPYTTYFDTFIGSKEDARTLLIIGIGILFIASINFMNLSIANAAHRLKEIGVRKVMGAFNGQVRVQFILEAIIITTISVIFAFGLVTLIIPFFNDFFDVSISWQILAPWQILAFGLGLVTIIGLMSGCYPAVYLSSLKSLDVLQKRVSIGGKSGLRNTLVVLQFTIALFLITTTLLIRNQISFMVDSDMGFSGDNTLVISASPRSFTNVDLGVVKVKTFQEELRSQSYVKNSAMSRAYPTQWTRSFTFVRPEGWTGDPLRMRYTYMDANFLEMYQIPLISGDYFLPDSEGHQRESVILNRAAMEAFDFEPFDENQIQLGDRKIRVVGITENFNYETLAEDVQPTLMFHRTADHPVHRYISLDIETSNLTEKIGEMEAKWNELGAVDEFSFDFLDDRVAQLYEAEDRYMGLVAVFSVISILVACLGLHGLSLFVIERRQKELSIRKVLGAETAKILTIILRDFTKWVVIAFVISVPIVVFFVQGWLETFYYRAPISWTTFGMTMGLVLGLVLFTVGYQSLKVAFSSPTRYLKDE